LTKKEQVHSYSLVIVSLQYRSVESEILEMTQPEAPLNALDGLPARPTGPWVHDKNYYLERYLDIFTRGVGRKWAGKLSYVDLLAGPGRSIIRGTGEEVEGSPFVALNCKFARYVFVDVPEVLATLKERLKGHKKSSQISLIDGDCNAVIDAVRATMPADHLTLAFIDPTGLQIQFRTIEQLVHNRKVDLLMTIQFGMGIRLNLRQYSQSEGDALTGFLGNSTWREDFELGGSPSQIGHRILDRYIRQLRQLGYETVKNREVAVRSNQHNLLLYFIVLASRHPRGQDFWRKITQIQPSGQRLLGL
jgi:three-Cys-motif partner protein